MNPIFGTWFNDHDAPGITVIYPGKHLESTQHQAEALRERMLISTRLEWCPYGLPSFQKH